jgi:cation diffusion facilitator family transporter
VPVLEGVAHLSASLRGLGKCVLRSKLGSAVVIVPELDPVTGVSAHRRQSACSSSQNACHPGFAGNDDEDADAIQSQYAVDLRGNKTGCVVGADDGSGTRPRHFHDAVGHHDHEHGDDHDHGEGHGREHEHHGGFRGALRGLVAPHSHDAKDSLDQALEGSRDGIRAVAISLAILLVTAGIQALVVVASGSVALLGDTLHNAADALTAIPLWLAFRLGRRAPTSRFTYGYGKAEDVAGVVVLALIVGSAAFAGYEAVDRLLHPQKITDLGLVMAAAVVGAIGNELVAQYRIRVGRRIGSAALEADGIHARTDGVTSLLVLIGTIAVAVGAEWADAVVGVVITAAILMVGYQAARSVGQRLLDAVDPAVVTRISQTVAAVPGVVAVTEVRARWMGHRLLAQVRLSVDGTLSVARAHEIAEVAHHELLHHVPNLSEAIIHVDPAGVGVDPHAATAHHRSTPQG